MAKGGYRCDQFLVVPKILAMKPQLMEGILFLVGPKTLNGVAVVEGVVLGLVPATKLGSKGIVFSA
jgi:hypothetical protein